MLPKFNNQQILVTALTHRSALNEKSSGTTALESNERLEFLGDAVLELVTTRFLFDKFPKKSEGELTAYRSSLVKTTTLAELAREVGLGQKMFMSKGEEETGGRENESLLADLMEAVIGALYLDQGLEVVNSFLKEHLFTKLAKIEEDKSYKDAKSLLQEVAQAKGFSTPFYKVASETGPDHDKNFTVNVIIDGKIYGSGAGKSKQLAQQAAAKVALDQFEADVNQPLEKN